MWPALARRRWHGRCALESVVTSVRDDVWNHTIGDQAKRYRTSGRNNVKVPLSDQVMACAIREALRLPEAKMADTGRQEHVVYTMPNGRPWRVKLMRIRTALEKGLFRAGFFRQPAAEELRIALYGVPMMGR